jgi:hypothetical protein
MTIRPLGGRAGDERTKVSYTRDSRLETKNGR